MDYSILECTVMSGIYCDVWSAVVWPGDKCYLGTVREHQRGVAPLTWVPVTSLIIYRPRSQLECSVLLTRV